MSVEKMTREMLGNYNDIDLQDIVKAKKDADDLITKIEGVFSDYLKEESTFTSSTKAIVIGRALSYSTIRHYQNVAHGFANSVMKQVEEQSNG
jgi:hypothetical protein